MCKLKNSSTHTLRMEGGDILCILLDSGFSNDGEGAVSSGKQHPRQLYILPKYHGEKARTVQAQRN